MYVQYFSVRRIKFKFFIVGSLMTELILIKIGKNTFLTITKLFA